MICGAVLWGKAANGTLTRCDRLAGSPSDPMVGKMGVSFASMDENRALKVCRERHRKYPKELRTIYNLGRALKKKGRTGEAVKYWTQACEDGYAEACNALGVYHLKETKRMNQSLSYFERACDSLGLYKSCNTLGVLYELGQGVAPSVKQARHYYTKACDAGYKKACDNLHALRMSSGNAKEKVQAERQVKKSCDGGSAISCFDYASAILESKPGPERFLQALEALKRSCTLGFDGACKMFHEFFGKAEYVEYYDPAKGKYGYLALIEGGQTPIINAGYDELTPFGKRSALVKKGKKYGIIDRLGRWLLKPRFDSIKGNFHDCDRVVVGIKDRYGVVDSRGKIVIPLRYEYMGYEFSEGLIAAETDGRWGYLDQNGSWKISPQFTYAGDFAQGMAPIRTSQDRYGYIDRNGTMAVAARYEDAREFSQGLGAVKENGRWGAVDRRGEAVIPPRYEEMEKFHEGLARVRKDGKYGYVDRNGKETIPPAFGDAGDFNEGLAPVKQGDLWGYIDTRGAWVIPPAYADAESFHHGHAPVKKAESSLWVLVDKKGKEAFPEGYDGLSYRGGRFWYAGFGSFYGVIDEKGKRYGFSYRLAKREIQKKRKRIQEISSGIVAANREAKQEAKEKAYHLRALIQIKYYTEHENENSPDLRESVQGLREYCEKYPFKTKIPELGRSACVTAAYAYMKGRGVAKNMATAEKLSEKGCEIGSGKACYFLTLILRDRIKTVADLQNTTRFAQKGCSLKYQKACQEAKELKTWLEKEMELLRRREQEQREAAARRAAAAKANNRRICDQKYRVCTSYCDRKENQGEIFSLSEQQKCMESCATGKGYCLAGSYNAGIAAMCRGVCQGVDKSTGLSIFGTSDFDRCVMECRERF